MIRKEIKENNTFGGNFPDNINYQNLPDNYIEITEEQRDYIDSNLDKLIFNSQKDGIYEHPKGIVDISGTEEYKMRVNEEDKNKLKTELQAQITELDLKSIRALREGGIKDSETNQSWLEFYTQEIINIRSQINTL